MNIIIHRHFAKDAEEAKRYLWDKFIKSGVKDAKLISGGYRIKIGDIYITFRYGDANRMAGARFIYFNTDNTFVSSYLAMYADVYGGRELKTLHQVFDVVMEYIRIRESEG